MDFDFIQKLVVPAQTKIILLVMDGLGGIPQGPGGRTELESARTPHLDALAARSDLGLSQPAGPGITVGSGPGHQAIFGYDPVRFEIGRGALEALGVDIDLQPGDVAARGNFCTVDGQGLITDRRAGRLDSKISQDLVDQLSGINIPGVKFLIRSIKEHRFALVARGAGLESYLTGTDPLQEGLQDLPVQALTPAADKAARVLNEFVGQARILLKDQRPANMILLRGFAQLPSLPQYPDCFGLRAAAIATNGMYKGVARLVGMSVLNVPLDTIASEIATLESSWAEYDYFFIHVKATDTCGADGDFQGKVRVIEEVDSYLPRLLALDPDVLIISGDHSTPAVMASHSWHPVPTLIYSSFSRPNGVAEFGERACARGSLGVFKAEDLILLALASAGRLRKFGA